MRFTSITALASLSTAACIVGCSNATTATRISTGPAPTVETVHYVRGLDETLGLQRDSAIGAVIAEINPANIRHTDSMLVSFGTRNTFSDTMSQTRGIGAARRWIKSVFDRYSRDCGGCLRVSYNGGVQNLRRVQGRDTTFIPVNIVNVLAWLPGRDTSRVVVMTGHYDSCVCGQPGGSFDSTSTAPGADDDGSGTSAIVELARAFSKHYPHGLNASVIFAAVASEEQGLNGARALAEWLHANGYKVVAGMTDDIVGNVVAEDGTADSTSFRIYAADPDNSPSRELARYTWALDRLYMPGFDVLPVWRLDRIGRGGDHEPYVTLGDAGLRFTERIENYNRQHLPTDDFSHVNFGYTANIARVNAVTVASLAASPATPANARATRQGRAGADPTGAAATPTGSGGQAWTLSWEPSAGAISYELLIRSTTAATWQQVIPLGNITRCTLRRQLDDEWAAVRAVGANGSRSMTASMPAPNPPRGTTPARGAAPPNAPGAAGRGGQGGQPGNPPVCGG